MSRRDRRKAARALHAPPAPGEEAAAMAESSARHDVDRIGGWRKGADSPLGDYLERRRGRRPPPSATQ